MKRTIVVDGRRIVMPCDRELMQLLGEASAILAATGLTTADLLDRLPAIREAVMRRTYGDAFVDELARDHARLHDEEPLDPTADPA